MNGLGKSRGLDRRMKKAQANNSNDILVVKRIFLHLGGYLNVEHLWPYEPTWNAGWRGYEMPNNVGPINDNMLDMNQT
jgi:hypothetical protein